MGSRALQSQERVAAHVARLWGRVGEWRWEAETGAGGRASTGLATGLTFPDTQEWGPWRGGVCLCPVLLGQNARDWATSEGAKSKWLWALEAGVSAGSPLGHNACLVF